jgi:flagellar biosynthesis chaperone FliJ
VIKGLVDDSDEDLEFKVKEEEKSKPEKSLKTEKSPKPLQTKKFEISESDPKEKKSLKPEKDDLKPSNPNEKKPIKAEKDDQKPTNPKDLKDPKPEIDPSDLPNKLSTILKDSSEKTFPSDTTKNPLKKPSSSKSCSTQTQTPEETDKFKTLQKIVKTQAKELESLRKLLSSKTSEIQSLNLKVSSLKQKKKTLKIQLSSKPCASHEADLNLKDKQIQDLKQKIEQLSVRPTEIFHKKNNFSETEFWKLDDDADKFEGLSLKEIAKNKALWIIKAEEKKTLNPMSTPNKSSLQKHKLVRRSLEPLTPKFSSKS